MQLAMVAAGFTPGEADQLRRAMAAWKRRGGLDQFEDEADRRACARAATRRSSREQIFEQIRGFGEYGFPEAHAASFALLAYVSAWLKHHHPAAFTAALLNSQPMGFYAPAQLRARCAGTWRRGAWRRRAAQRRGDARSKKGEGEAGAAPGLRSACGRCRKARRNASCRPAPAPLSTPLQDLGDRAGRCVASWKRWRQPERWPGWRATGTWRTGTWPVTCRRCPSAPDAISEGARPLLRAPTEAEDIVADYRALGFTLGRHPLALLRERLEAPRILRAQQLGQCTAGSDVRVAGLVITRQRPQAGGVTFVTLEDESGTSTSWCGAPWASAAPAGGIAADGGARRAAAGVGRDPCDRAPPGGSLAAAGRASATLPRFSLAVATYPPHGVRRAPGVRGNAPAR